MPDVNADTQRALPPEGLLGASPSRPGHLAAVAWAFAYVERISTSPATTRSVRSTGSPAYTALLRADWQR
ncbi:hypothetical protein SGRIM119S_08468 [Streptomyces griseorubiginosus]